MRQYGLIFLLICFAQNYWGQEMTFSNLTTAQGLSSNIIYDIIQDSRGFIWIGTKDGLNQYDGTSVKVYKYNRKDSTSLPGNWVISLAEDKKGFIWVGTWDGVAKMNPYNGKFTRYQHNENQVNSLPVNGDNKVFCDKEGNIWIINPKGLCLFEEKTATFRMVLPLSDYGLSLSEDRQGNLWVGSIGAMYNLDKKTYQVQKRIPFPQSPEKNVIQRIYEDTKGMIWAAMWGGGLAYLEEKTGKFQTYTLPASYKEQAGEGFIAMDIHEQILSPTHRIIWVAKYGELLRLDIYDDIYPKDLEKAVFYVHQKDIPYSYLGGETRCIFADRQGTLWIGTNNGISRIIANNQRFTYFPPYFNFGLTYLQYDPSNAKTPFWVMAWYGHESCRLDSNMQVVQRWKSIPPNASLDAGNVSEVAKDAEGNYWLATFDGLVKYNEQKNTFQQFTHQKDDPNSLHSNKTTAICIGKDGKIWLSLYNQGINTYDPTTQKWTLYQPQANKPNSLPHHSINSIWEDSKGRIWLLSKNGLGRYNPQTDDFSHFTGKKNAQIEGNDLSKMLENEDGSYWISSNKGVNLWYPLQDSAILFSVEEGLDNTNVIDMEKDNLGNLWILTENQLNLFNPKQKTFTHFGKENGFLSQAHASAIAKDNKGNLYVGDQDNRICRFNPLDFSDKEEQLPLYINEVRIDGEALLQDTAIAENQTFYLKYYENQLYISFTAIDLITSSQIKYACKLGNADKDWQEIGNRQFISYANVPPGEYLFSVKVSDCFGHWQAPKNIRFIISPPFWKTTPFLIFIALLSLALFGWLVRLIFTRQLREKILILEKEQAIERERNRISQDMHDDIGSGLSKIVILSEVLQRQKEFNAKTENQLQSISQSAREIIDNLQHIVWFLYSGNDSVENLVAYIREYAARYLENVELSYEFDFPSNFFPMLLSTQIRRNLFLVIKEALNNLTKYAEATKVKMTCIQTENSISFIIEDNGKGFDKSSIRRFGNGLRNMEARMKEIGGECRIESKVGEGTRVIVVYRL